VDEVGRGTAMLGLEEGETFVVYAEDDNILFKRVRLPTDEKLADVLAEGRAHARDEGITRDEVAAAIDAYRRDRST